MERLINGYYWTILVFFQFFGVAYLSFRANNNKTTSSLLLLYSVGLIPSWTIMCKYSNNIVLMGYLYDFLLAAGWTTGVIVFQNKSLCLNHYLVIILMVCGLLLFKKP